MNDLFYRFHGFEACGGRGGRAEKKKKKSGGAELVQDEYSTQQEGAETSARAAAAMTEGRGSLPTTSNILKGKHSRLWRLVPSSENILPLPRKSGVQGYFVNIFCKFAFREKNITYHWKAYTLSSHVDIFKIYIFEFEMVKNQVSYPTR